MGSMETPTIMLQILRDLSQQNKKFRDDPLITGLIQVFERGWSDDKESINTILSSLILCKEELFWHISRQPMRPFETTDGKHMELSDEALRRWYRDYCDAASVKDKK